MNTIYAISIRELKKKGLAANLLLFILAIADKIIIFILGEICLVMSICFFFSNRNDFSLLSTSTLLRHVSNYDYDFKPYENVLLSVKK